MGAKKIAIRRLSQSLFRSSSLLVARLSVDDGDYIIVPTCCLSRIQSLSDRSMRTDVSCHASPRPDECQCWTSIVCPKASLGLKGLVLVERHWHSCTVSGGMFVLICYYKHQLRYPGSYGSVCTSSVRLAVRCVDVCICLFLDPNDWKLKRRYNNAG